MSHLDNSVYNDQKFFQSNRTNFQIDRNQQIPFDFKPFEQQINIVFDKQIGNDLQYIGQRNMKLKQDYAVNKSKLLTSKNFMVQPKRISSMDITQNNVIWQTNNINGKNLQFKSNISILPNTPKNTPYMNNQAFINANQQNKQNLSNLYTNNIQQGIKSTQIEELLLKIRDYQEKIEILNRNERIYIKQIQQYKEKLNKSQSILHQKQSIILTQKSTIFQLEQKFNVKLSENERNSSCTSCDQLTKKISFLTKQITDLTNQLNLKTQKLRNSQRVEKENSCLQYQIKMLKSEFEQKIKIYQQELVQTHRNSEERQKIKFLEFQIENYKHQNNKLKIENIQQRNASQILIQNLSLKNHKLVQDIELYIRQLEGKNQVSSISNRSNQESVLVEYEKSIQILQEQVYSLRKTLIQKQNLAFSNQQRQAYQNKIRQISIQLQASESKINQYEGQIDIFQRTVNQHKKYNEHLSIQNNKYHEKVIGLQNQISQLYTKIDGMNAQNINLKQVIQQLRQKPDFNVNVEKTKIQHNVRLLVQNEYQLRIQSFERQIISLNEKYSHLVHNFTTVQNQNQLLVEQIQKLRQQLHDSELKHQQRPKSFSLKQQEEYAKQIGQVKHELQCSKKMIAQLFAKIQQNNQQDSNKQEEISERYKKHYEVVISKQNKEIEGLNDEINRLIIEMRKYSNYSELASKISILEKENYQSKAKFQQTYQSLIRAEEYIETSEKRIHQLQNQINIASVPQINFDQNVINVKDQHISNLQQQLAKALDRARYLQQQIQRLNTSTILSLKSSITQLTNQNKNIQSILNKNANQVNLKSEEIQRLNKLIRTKQVEINGLKQSVSDTKDQFSKYISQEPRNQVVSNQELLLQLKNLENMVEQITNEKNNLFQHLKKAQQYIFELQQNNYEQVISQLRITINGFEHQKNILLGKQRDLQKMLHEQAQSSYTPDNQSSQEDKLKILAYTKQISILKERIINLERQISKLEGLNKQLQQRLLSLKIQNENNKKSSSSEIERYKQLIIKLQREREDFLSQVSQMKSNLQKERDQQDRPQSMKRISESRIKVDQFVQQNRRIMQKLMRAENYIGQLQFRCQQYLAEIERLRNGTIPPQSVAGSRKTIRDMLEEETPIRNIQSRQLNAQSHFYQQNVQKIGESQEIILTMRRQIESTNQIVRNLRFQISSLERQKQQISQKNAKLLQVLSQNEIKISQVSAFDTQRREFERLIVKLQSEKSILGNQNKRLSQQVKTASQEIRTVQSKWEEIRNNLRVIEVQKEKLLEQVKDQRVAQVQSSSKHLLQINELKVKISDVQKTNQNLQRINKVLKQSTLESGKSLTHKLDAEVSTIKEQLNKTQLQLKDVRQNLKEAEQFIALNESIFMKSEQETQLLHHKMAELERNLLNLHNINHLLQLEIDQRSSKSQLNNQNEKSIYSQKIVILDQQIHNLKNQHQHLISVLQSKQIEINNLNIKIGSIKKIQHQYNEVQQQLDQRKSEFQKVSDQLKSYEDDKLARTLQIDSLRNQIKIVGQKLKEESTIQFVKLQEQHKVQVEKFNSEKRFLEDSISQLNGLIQRDRKMISELQNNLKGLLGQKSAIENKLKEAEDFIIFLQQQKTNFSGNNQLLSKLQEQKSQILQRLVHAESVIMTLEMQLERLAQQGHKKQEQSDKKNNRIQEQLQQTVIRVSQEHIHLTAIIQKLQKENNDLKTKISQLLSLENAKIQTNSRVLDQMKATISRISQENKILLNQNSQYEKLKDDYILLKQSIQKINQEHTHQKEVLSTQTLFLQQSTNKLAETNAHLTQQNQQFKSELLSTSLRLQESVSQFNSQQNNQNQYNKMSESLNQITSSLQQKSELISSLQTSLRNQRSKNTEAEEQKNFFQGKLYEAQQYIAQTEIDKKELVRKYDQLNNEIQNLRRLNRIEERSNEQNEVEEVSKSMDNNSLINLSNIQQQNDQRLNQIQQKNQKLEQIVRQLNDNIKILQDEKLKGEQKMKVLLQDNEKLSQLINRFQEQSKKSSNELIQSKRILDELNSSEKMIEELKKAVDAHMQQNKKFEGQLSNQRDINEQLKSALDQTINQQLKSQQESDAVNLNLKNQISNANSTLNSLSITNQNQNSQIQSLNLQVSNQNDQIFSLNATIQSLNNQVQSLENQKLQIQLKGRQAFTQELQAHKKLNNQLIQANHQNKKQLNFLRQKALQSAQTKHQLHQLQHQLIEKNAIQIKLKQAQQHIRHLYEQDQRLKFLNQTQTTHLKQSIQEFKNQEKALTNNIHEAEKRIKQLQNVNERLKNDVIQQKQEQINKINSQLKQQVKLRSKQTSELSHEVQKIGDQNKALHKQIETLNSQNLNILRQMKGYEASLQEKIKHIRHLQHVADASKQTAQVKLLYEEQIKSNTKRIQELLHEVNSLNSLNQSLNKKIQQKLQSLSQASKKLNEIQIQNNQLSNLHQHLMEQISEQHIKVGKKLEQIQALKKIITEKDQKIKSLETDKELQHKKIKELQQIHSKLFEAEKYILELQNRLSFTDKELKQSVESKNELNSSQQLQISHLSSDLKQLSNLLSQKEQQLTSSNTELLSIKQKLVKLEQKLDEQQKMMRQKNDESVENSHEITLLNDRLKENEEQLLETKLKLRDLQIRNEETIGNLQRLNKQSEALENENSKLKEENKEYELRLLNTLEQSLAEKEQLSKRVKQLQNFTQSLQQSKLTDEKEKEKLNSLLKEIHQQNSDLQVNNENSRRINEENRKEIEEMAKIKDHLGAAETYISDIDSRYNQLDMHAKNLENQKNILNIKVKNLQDNLKDALNSTKIIIPEVKKNGDDSSLDTIHKHINKLTQFVQQNDSLDFYKEENIERQLSANPIFKRLYQAIKYKFKLLNAIDSEKSVTLSQKQKQIAYLKNEMKKIQQVLRDMSSKINQAEVIQTSYKQVLTKLIETQRLNNALSNEVSMLNNQLSIHKSQIQQFQSKIQNQSSSLSAEGDKVDTSDPKQFLIDQKLKQENLKLRKELQEAEYQLHKIKHNANNFDSYNNSPILSPASNKRIFMNNESFQLFLKQCLVCIQDLQQNVSGIEKDMIFNKQNVEKLLVRSSQRPVLGSKRSQDSLMLQKIKQLQEKLEQNDKRLKQHQIRAQNQLIGLLKQSILNPLKSSDSTSKKNQFFDKEKVEKYLEELQNVILKKEIEHHDELQRLKNLVDKKSVRNQSSISPYKKGAEDEQEKKNIDVEDLLRQIQGLHNHIQIYDEEAFRRKQKYRRTVEDLLREIEDLKREYEKQAAQCGSTFVKEPVSSILEHLVLKTKNVLEHQNSQDLDQKSDYLNDDDYIMSNNYVKYIKSNKGVNQPQTNRDKQFVQDLGSIAQQFQNKQSSLPYDERRHGSNIENNLNPLSIENKILNFSNNNLSKDELLSKPILEFIVQNKDFDNQEIKLLKKKINDIQLRSNQEKLQLLKQNVNKVIQILEKRKIIPQEKQTNSEVNLDLMLNTLANNLTKQEVDALVFIDEALLGQQIGNKLQQLLVSLDNSSSFLKQENNSYEMMQVILEIKSKFYPDPTPLSEQMYHHLIKLLSSKDDQQFYSLVESLFSYLSQLENDFLLTLKQKEEMYQKHTQKMNEVLGVNDESQQDLDEEDEEYYKRILLIGRDEEKEVERIRRQETQKGLSEQLEIQIQKSKTQE